VPATGTDPTGIRKSLLRSTPPVSGPVFEWQASQKAIGDGLTTLNLFGGASNLEVSRRFSPRQPCKADQRRLDLGRTATDI
jgi:hypothetical protein